MSGPVANSTLGDSDLFINSVEFHCLVGFVVRAASDLESAAWFVWQALERPASVAIPPDEDSFHFDGILREISESAKRATLLPDNSREELAEAVRRARSAAWRRNRLVHSQWHPADSPHKVRLTWRPLRGKEMGEMIEEDIDSSWLGELAKELASARKGLITWHLKYAAQAGRARVLWG